MSGPNHPRGTSNGNARGSSKDRQRRKLWLIETFGNTNGVAECMAEEHHADCPGTVTIETVTVDRIIMGRDGGTYRRDNIRPAFGLCNSVHGGGRQRARQP